MRNCSSKIFCLPPLASSMPWAVRRSRSASVKMPCAVAGEGRTPSLTPSTKRYLISGRRLRSISPIRRQSAVGGMTPMEHFSRPALRIFAISSKVSSSLPRMASAFSRTSITNCQIWRYSSALLRLPAAVADCAQSSSVSAAWSCSRWESNACKNSRRGKAFFCGRASRGAKGASTLSRRALTASTASAPSRWMP